MKPNKLTPGSNLKWEASRMMLPEHVAQLQERRINQKRKNRPILDEQQIEELERMINDYITCGKPVFLTIFGEFEDREIRGRITKIEPTIKRLKIETEDYNNEWFSFEDILDIYL